MLLVVLAQGYKSVMKSCMESARLLREGLKNMGRFEIISKEKGVPLVAFSFKDRNSSLPFMLSKALRQFGWIVPAYTMPEHATHVTLLRVVVREDFGRPLVEKFLSHVEAAVKEVDTSTKVSAPRFTFTVELIPSETAEDGDFGFPATVVLKQEPEAKYKQIPLGRTKTKGVC